MFSEGYPANTVKGRICLNYRLAWDKDTSKETSDIYIKPRLIVIATILTIGCVLFYAIQRVKTFVPKFCPSNRSHASIGGRYRRNLLTFDELSKTVSYEVTDKGLCESLAGGYVAAGGNTVINKSMGLEAWS